MWPFSSSLLHKRSPAISGQKWFNVSALPELAKQKALAGADLRFREELAGKVVLIDFWDYSCINCLHTLPYLREWWNRYREYNFLIIGVHTPEFEFAKDADKVESAVLRFDLSYPVVSDPDFITWKAYRNTVWPRDLIVDSRGIVRYDHRGEGGYVEKEKKIQDLLSVLHPQAVFDDPMTAVHETDEEGAICRPATPEIYVGAARGKSANKEGFAHGRQHMYVLPHDVGMHQWALSGEWQIEDHEALSWDGAVITLHYMANEVFAVMRPIGSSFVDIEVQHDDAPLAASDAGEDIVFVDGKSIVRVDSDRLYRLVSNAQFGQHFLTLHPRRGRVALYTFTFRSSCQ